MSQSELPPRARRIQHGLIEQASGLGTTSACAENTPLISTIIFPYQNYLRVRGEYFLRTINEPYNWELPPRARRIRCMTT